MQGLPCLVFGLFRLDLRDERLWRGEAAMHLHPKTLAVLHVLAAQAGKLVTKDALFAAVWPETAVSGSVLTVAIRQLRRALGDQARLPQFIETVHGRGYRFIAPVTVVEPFPERSQRAGTLPQSWPVTRGHAVDIASTALAPPRELAPFPAVPRPPSDLQPDDTASRASAPGAPPSVAAERRQLTILCSELVDSSRLAGQLDPEDYRDMVHAYHGTCAAVIQRFDGYNVQYSWAGLLVYFGYPQAHDDDAYRAVRAGLDMVQALQRLNTRLEWERGMRLAMRLGIHTGPVIVSDMGKDARPEPLALGETPHIAAWLQEIAAPDTVVISQTTYQLTRGSVACEALGTQVVRGGARSMAVYRVLAASETQSRLDAVMPKAWTPLVGREREIGLLLERWEQARAGMGQVVVLIGEGGIGKSRLVAVLKEQVADTSTAQVECRGSPLHQQSALYPLIDFFHRALHWQRHDTADVKLQKLEAALAQYSPALTETVPLFAALLSLPLAPERYPPLSLSPHQQKHKTFEALLILLAALAAQRPVLFVVEDLHYLDPSTLEFLDLLLAQGPTARLLTLLTCRPTFQPPWSFRAHVALLTLGRLSPEQTAQMVTGVAEGKTLPPEVLQQVVTKSDGVPLFVEELTKMVLESGVLREHDGRYALAEPLTAVAIPSTLQDSLMARLDRLTTAKSVAQLGATLGRTFSYEVLQAVSPLDETTLQHELARLVAGELLYQRGVPPKATYIFKHVLIQEIAYQSLLRSTRQQYHRHIAQVLEALLPETAETQPELLAQHYTEAGLSAQAIPWWQRAGQRALKHSAHVEAISHLTRGLEVLARLPDTAARAQQELSLHMGLGHALMATRSYAVPEVAHTYARARTLCHQVGDTPELVAVLYGIFGFHATRAEYMTARELGEECLRLAQRQHDPGLRLQALLQAHRMIGIPLFFLGEFVAARTHTDQAVARCVAQQHCLRAWQDPMVTGLMFAACVLWSLGHPDQALRRSQEALTLARQCAAPYTLVWALIYAAGVRLFRREPQHAHRLAEEALARATAQEFLSLTAASMFYQGGALALQEQHAEGLAQMRQGLATYQALGVGLGRSLWLALLAEATGNAGQAAEGLVLVAEARAWVDIHAERFWEAELHRLQGRLVLQDAPPDAHQAEACFQQALAVARRQHAKSLELRAALSLGRLWQQQGKRAEARELLAPLYGWFTEGLDTADLQEAKALLEELRGGSTHQRATALRIKAPPTRW
jgi:class 3 adenylate cyclase/predicted ATPase